MKSPLDPDTWARVSPLLDQALEVPPEELEDWLEQLSTSAPDLAPALRSLLSERGALQAQGFLEEPLLSPEDVPSLPGQQVGAYTVDSLLGRGGMGEVWLAWRSDGRFKGRFAVKFLDTNSAAANAQDRFRREGRMLARLTHPNIARLIDAGVTPLGRPYLVLEYVEGERIDQYCDAHSLGVEARVRLFLDVLAAVAHAHSNLVVHRDIKPSNVLVTPDGAVKLLDFGIAKLIGPELSTEDESAPTRIEDIALTPDYAAPEQILGEPPSTATDVYQLGVLLYVLLAAQLPIAVAGKTRSERIRAALDDLPARPSEVAAGPWRKALRGDLDAIIGKALRKRPDERYPTAAALAAELQRYLDHEPVKAREGALAYRGRKFVRRYRGAVIGTAAAALALLLTAAFALLQMREAQAQRDQARFQEKRAEAESRFMTLMMSTVGDGGKPVTPSQILDKGLELLEKQYADDPAFRATMLVRMAARFMDLGNTSQEYAALLKAEALARQLDDPARLAEIECDAVQAELDMGNADQAAVRLADGKAALARVSRPSVANRAECLDAEASLTEARGDMPAAIAAAMSAVNLMETAGETHDVQYTDLLSHVAQLYAEAGDIKLAYEFHLRDGAALERNGQGDTESDLSVRHNIASDLMDFGEITAAYEREREVMARATAGAGNGKVQPPITTTFGNLQLRLDLPDAALQSFDASLGAARQTGDLVSQLYAHTGRARAFIASHRLDEADAELKELQRLAKGQETAHRRPLGRAQIAYAEMLFAEGRLAEARQRIDGALTRLRDTTTGGVGQLGAALLMSSRIALADHRFADAERASLEALGVFERRARKPEWSADVGESLLLLAEARRSLGQPTEAHAAAARAVLSLKSGLGAEHRLTLEAATFN